MQVKVLNEAPERSFALVLDSGDEVVRCIESFAAEHALTAARLFALGALRSAMLGYFDWERKAYERIPVNEQVEVLSLVGDIAQDGRRPKLHAHVVLGRCDGSTRGGHLLQGQVRPTLEVLLTESPQYLQRVHDPESGLALIRVGA